MLRIEERGWRSGWIYWSRGGVPVGFSQMFIEAVMMDPNERLGRTLSLKTPSAALALTQTMYLTDGSPVQWSRDTFLPGHLNLHVVRELFEVRKLP